MARIASIEGIYLNRANVPLFTKVTGFPPESCGFAGPFVNV